MKVVTTTRSYQETRHDMPRLRYQLTNGNTVGERDVNVHHCLWPKRTYELEGLRAFRNLPGFVLPLHIPEHNALHTAIDPPALPGEWLREEIAEFADSVYETDDYAAFEKIAHHIGDVANRSLSPQLAQEAFDLHANFYRQQEFIDAGRVIPIGRL